MIQLQLENTSTCNAKCGFCVYPTAERWGGNMSMHLFQKVLNEAEGIPQISQVCITGLGEPLLDRDIVARVAYARRKKPEAHIDLFTNGVYLLPYKFDQLREAGISGVNVSLNAVNADQHMRIMGLRDKFDQVCLNLEHALERRGRVQVEVRAVIDGLNFTPEDASTFLTRWGRREDGGAGAVIAEGNWAGANVAKHSFDENDGCGRALSQIYVTFDGMVTTCCFDPTGKRVFGDLNLQTIKEVYSNPAYVEFRELHSDNLAAMDSMCKNCTRI